MATRCAVDNSRNGNTPPLSGHPDIRTGGRRTDNVQLSWSVHHAWFLSRLVSRDPSSNALQSLKLTERNAQRILDMGLAFVRCDPSQFCSPQCRRGPSVRFHAIVAHHGVQPVDQHQRQELARQTTEDFDRDPRVPFCELSQYRREEELCVTLPHTQPNFTLDFRLLDVLQGSIAQVQQLAALFKQHPPGLAQFDRAPFPAMDQFATQYRFKALHLQTNRRLGPADPRGRSREASLVRDRNEGAQ